MRSILQPLLIIFLLCFTSLINSQTIVLQEGRDGYDGCDDSFIMYNDYGPFTTLNFGNADTIYTDICYT